METTAIDIGTLITRTPGVVGGRPRIAGTRMPVLRISVLHNSGMSPEEIVSHYGHLTLAQVHAALAYYYANKAEIDADLEAEERLYEELASKHKSLNGPIPDLPR